MRLFLEDCSENLGQRIASYIVDKINSCTNQHFVLGLPTGSTPLPTYKALIKFYQEKKVSFQNVITFNMDEYLKIAQNHPRSYYTFMQNNFLKHIDINPENSYFLNGMTENKVRCCQEYEDKITQVGGIDLFLGGLGENGHIAFNEPFSSLTSLTREKQLTKKTIEDNARFFSKDESQPTSALTVGIQTIMNAREVIIVATGKNKAQAVKETLLGSVSHYCPSTILQTHRCFSLACDNFAVKHISIDDLDYFKHITKMGG